MAFAASPANIHWTMRRSSASVAPSAFIWRLRKMRTASAARVLIGRDPRESGPHIAELIARGLVSAGAEPVSAGVVTTPGVAWLVSREGFSAGVVISASHNPYHDNGVKLISSSGMKFPDAAEHEIERLILSPKAKRPLPGAPQMPSEQIKSIRMAMKSCIRIISTGCAPRCCLARNSRG